MAGRAWSPRLWADALLAAGERTLGSLSAPRLRVRWLVLRLLGLTLLIASASLWTQVIALSGARGVVPFAEVLEGYARQFGPLERRVCWVCSTWRRGRRWRSAR